MPCQTVRVCITRRAAFSPVGNSSYCVCPSRRNEGQNFSWGLQIETTFRGVFLCTRVSDHSGALFFLSHPVLDILPLSEKGCYLDFAFR